MALYEWCRTSRAGCPALTTAGCSTVFSGFCDLARRGLICLRSGTGLRTTIYNRFNR